MISLMFLNQIYVVRFSNNQFIANYRVYWKSLSNVDKIIQKNPSSMYLNLFSNKSKIFVLEKSKYLFF